jgi:hypothetical protein
MSDIDQTEEASSADPDDWPFEPLPIEGIPFKRGSAEDLAIRRVLERQGDPDESPFQTPPIEGMPFKRGSAEDLAIRRIIEREAGAAKDSN